MPVYAANLTLLEPTKGPTPPSETKTDVNKLVDTSKADDKPTKNQVRVVGSEVMLICICLPLLLFVYLEVLKNKMN